MVPPGQDFTVPNTEELGDYAVVHAPDHLRAIALDRQAGRISTDIIVASSRVAMLAQGVGTVVTVFDRARISVGPRGFSTPLLSSLFEICDGLAVLAYTDGRDTVEVIERRLDDPSDHRSKWSWVQPGGAWWLHVEINKARRDERMADVEALEADLKVVVAKAAARLRGW